MKNTEGEDSLDKNKKEQWESCPRCGSTNVKKESISVLAIAGLGLSGCGFWLLIIPFLGILMIISGLLIFAISVIALIASLFQKDILRCHNCNKVWRYGEEGVF